MAPACVYSRDHRHGLQRARVNCVRERHSGRRDPLLVVVDAVDAAE
jgi:hypothetical protein